MWNPFRRKRHLPPMWTPYLRFQRWPAAQLRLTAWIGMLLGLLAYQATRLMPPPEHLMSTTAAVEPLDPYYEARRSRAILDAQEGAPSLTVPGGEVEARGSNDETRRAPAMLEAQEGAPWRTVTSIAIETRAISGAVRVIDGDTFDYQGTRVRVADIDTPEVHGRCAYETELAVRATRRMRALLAAGPFEMHQLAGGRDEDRYGRKLRIVTRNGRSLGDLLVAEGLARTWTGRREPWCV